MFALRQLIGGLLLSLSLVTHASIRILITKGIESARPVAILPFTWSGASPPESIEQIIRADLDNSGQFKSTDPKEFPELPKAPQQVKRASWTRRGIDTLVMGSISATEDHQFIISFQMINTTEAGERILAEGRYKVQERWLRYAAHTISDIIFEKLTATPGCFRTRIAYVAHDEENTDPFELRIADYDGFNPKTVHRSSEPIMSPAWSPDGRHLSYVSFENRRAELVEQDLTTAERKVLAGFSGHNGAPAYSPNGEQVALVLSKDTSFKLYLLHRASGTLERLTSGRSNDTEPAWSTDGKALFFTSDRSGTPQVYRIDIETNAVNRVTFEGLYNQAPQITPDGQFLILVHTDVKTRTQHLARQNLVTGELTILTNASEPTSPSLSPNGNMIIYASRKNSKNMLQLVSGEGGFHAELPVERGQAKAPAWSPRV